MSLEGIAEDLDAYRANVYAVHCKIVDVCNEESDARVVLDALLTTMAQAIRYSGSPEGDYNTTMEWMETNMRGYVCGK